MSQVTTTVSVNIVIARPRTSLVLDGVEPALALVSVCFTIWFQVSHDHENMSSSGVNGQRVGSRSFEEVFFIESYRRS